MFDLVPILAGTLAAATPLILAGMGELVTERSGVLNLGVEGMMLIGAIAAFAVQAQTGCPTAIALCIGALAGMLAALLFAILALSLAVHQAACGLAMTIFGVGLSAFIGKNYSNFNLPGMPVIKWPLLSDLPGVGPILFQQTFMVYLALVIFGVTWWVLAKTRTGLIIKAVGESPESAHALGYPVLAIRYLATLFGGLMAGLAGAYLSTVYTPLWVDNLVAGRGWIAIALVVFATWRPLRLLLGAYLFGGVTLLQFHAQALGLNVPNELLAALPYAATIVVLVLISRNRQQLQLNLPASLGRSYLP